MHTDEPVRVVVVDDQARARFLVRAAVDEVGYEVVGEASDGAKGVGAVAIHEPDLVVVDYLMPVMDGLEATKAIKQRFPGVEVIAHTANSDSELQNSFLDAGACDHVEKGDVNRLTSALRRCTQSRKPLTG